MPAVHRHTRAPLETFPFPKARFANYHIDLIDPLAPSRCNIFILICIDGFTVWSEAIAMSESKAKTIAYAFLKHFIASYVCPVTGKTNRGQPFEIDAFYKLLATDGSSLI